MPIGLRPNLKAKKIAYMILGIPLEKKETKPKRKVYAKLGFMPEDKSKYL